MPLQPFSAVQRPTDSADRSGVSGRSCTASEYRAADRVAVITDAELSKLRARAADGDSDAVDELVERAGERGDFEELRRQAAAGSRDAADELVQLAGERGDLEELRLGRACVHCGVGVSRRRRK